MIDRNALAALISVFSIGTLYADTLQFGVAGSPIDLSANVSESILPGGSVFQDSKPLFGTTPDPKQSAELLHVSRTGVNASGRSTNISGAFASSLAESNGNGGVGVSQLIFASPGGSGQGVRQLVAQSLWTQTFVYNGSDPAEITMHFHIPALEVRLFGVPPRRDFLSATETAEASAKLVTEITHPNLTQIKGRSFEFGLRESERQIPSGSDLLNLADAEVLGQTAVVSRIPPEVKPFGDEFSPGFFIDDVSFDLGGVGLLHQGDTFSYVYTLTAQGTTHGFERGYDAFLGDPFGVDVITDSLTVTFAPASVPELSTSLLMLLGLAGLFVWCRHKALREDLTRVIPRTPAA